MLYIIYTSTLLLTAKKSAKIFSHTKQTYRDKTITSRNSVQVILSDIRAVAQCYSQRTTVLEVVGSIPAPVLVELL